MLAVSESLQLRLTWQDPTTGEHCQCVGPLPVMIGRAASINTIVLNNKLVSRQHARLESDGGTIVLVDQDSTNGTLLDGRPIKRAPLGEGHRFQIGPFVFTAATLVAVAD